MDMQDNEFDELFRSKLDEFEIEPSAKVWPGIAEELRSAKHKKTWMPWLSMAASIIVLAGIGLLFITPKTVKNITKPAQSAIAKVPTQVSVNNVPNKPVPNIKLVSAKPRKAAEIGKIVAVTTPVKSPATNVNNTDPEVTNSTPVKNVAPEVIAVISQKQPANIAVVPDKTTVLTPPLPAQNTPDITTKPVLLASQVPGIAKKDSAQVKARHKIHGLAGLVSMVIAKVDKRKDAAQGDDDNESNIVGVNLGLVKIKKGE